MAKGVTIESGVSDFQIFQRRSDGTADIAVSGRWECDNPLVCVEIRLVHEDTGTPVTANHDWTKVESRPDGSWSGVLKNVPAGGLYRLETHVMVQGDIAQEWARRGDMRHFLGIGDLWIIAGQSNSAGYGRGPYIDPPELGIHIYNNAMRWAIATQPMNESTDSAHPVNNENGNSGHSPWLHWARLVKQAIGVPIGLIQTSLGGSPLSRWNPTQEGKADLYDNMISCVQAVGGQAKGVLWYQGCSDTDEKQSATYENRFINAVTAWRKNLNNSELFVLTVQLNRYFGVTDPKAHLYWSVVREAQRQIPKKLSNTGIIPSLDLPLCDFIHTSPAGNMLLADRAAQTVLAEVYGQNLAHRAPDIRTAQRTPDGKQITLTFDHVTSRIDAPDPNAIPFLIEDAVGPVPISKISYPGGPVLTLELQRPLSGQTWITAAYGANPPAIPFDMVRFIPILAFHRVQVD